MTQATSQNRKTKVNPAPLTADSLAASLANTTGLPAPVCHAMVTTWASLVRHHVLLKAPDRAAFLEDVAQGKGELRLTEELAPATWNRIPFPRQLAREVGLYATDVPRILRALKSEIDRFPNGVCLSPLGDFTPVEDGYHVRLRPDLYQLAAGEGRNTRSAIYARNIVQTLAALMPASPVESGPCKETPAPTAPPAPIWASADKPRP